MSAVETEEGRRWAESKIKMLTGGDTVAARFIGQDFFEYQPEFKLLIVGNHKPALRGVDEAIRRRMNLIPFTVTIPESERDEALPVKLKAEWPQILQWMLDGWFDCAGEGLSPPEAVQRATDEYLAEEDAIGQWMAECCKVKAGFYSTVNELYGSWRSWAEKAGEFIGSQKQFSRTLKDRAGLVARRQSGTGRAGFAGIGILAPELSSAGDGESPL